MEVKPASVERCPVYWQHGFRDDCVLPEMQEDGVRRLKASGVTVTCVRDQEAGHVPGVAQIAGLQQWLEDVLYSRQ